MLIYQRVRYVKIQDYLLNLSLYHHFAIDLYIYLWNLLIHHQCAIKV